MRGVNMAVSRLGHIKEAKGNNKSAGLKNVIEYILNPAKTEDYKYVDVKNMYMGTKVDYMDLYNQMVDTKKAFNKLEGRQGYHYKFSFADKDNISPEMAMEITGEIIDKLFPQYETVYSVHTNTAHIHSHVVFNSIDFIEGYKYYYKKGDWRKIIQPVVNDICLKHKLSYIDLTTYRDDDKENRYRTYGEWLKDNKKKKNAKPYKLIPEIRKDVDECISLAADYDEFKKLMEEKDYKVNDKGKYIKLMMPGREKYIRLYTLTPDKRTYTNENLIKMINGSFKPIDRAKVIEQMYKDFNIFLNTRRIDIVTKKDRNNIDFAKAQETYKFIEKNNISSKDELIEYISYLEQADKELNILKRNFNTNISRYEEYEVEMDIIISNIKYVKEYNITGDHKPERDKCIAALQKLLKLGISPSQLYINMRKSEKIINEIDKFKKKIYVDKIIAKRALSNFDTDGGKDRKNIDDKKRENYNKISKKSQDIQLK